MFGAAVAGSVHADGVGEYLESCSRAKLNLAIVTYQDKVWTDTYKKFTEMLR